MNERIRELSSQARDYARGYVAECKQYGYYMEHNEYDLQFEAKFAELIIKECADYAEYQLQIGGTNADKIKQHFGVK